MIKSKTAMAFLWALFTLLLHVLPGPIQPRLAHAQGTRKDDIVFNSRGIPLAGATVRVCAMPATGQPCTPLALIYSDPGLTQALTNPTTTDGLGNYFFYAAPGKYEIEISGPNITTKQLPNVVLPNDPSSPAFNAVSAFSLTLGGNLTVSGNTTVLGNLASGTLNVTNQSTLPGTPASGTVNVYTKSADKRLYYKDDTGAEIGPLGPGTGAQTNVANTFTAPQSIAADFHTKGPNPTFDLLLNGGYQATTLTPPTITCTTTASQNTMTCPGGVSDFIVGHGVAIPLAGPAPTMQVAGANWSVSQISVSSNIATVTVTQPSSFNGSSAISGSTDAAFNGTFTATDVTTTSFTFPVAHANCSPCSIGSSVTVNFPSASLVTPQGILNGSTTWNYKVVPIGFHWELQAASAAFTTTTGAAALGLNSATIAANGCVENNGIVTFTTSAAHNFQSGVPVNIPRGVTGTGAVEGSWVIASTPSSTTFTIDIATLPNGTYCPSGGTAQVVAKNLIQWGMQPYQVAGYYIYRSQGAGAYSLIGQRSGMDSSFTDWGLPALNLVPAWVPTTPPTSPLNGILATTITAINGTTVTLATNAIASASNSTVSHDNTPNILNVCTSSLFTAQGGEILLSQGTSAAMLWPLNSPLDMHPCAPNTQITLGADIVANFPISPNHYNMFAAKMAGADNGNNVSFGKYLQGYITGNGRPLILEKVANNGDITFKDITLNCGLVYQNCIVQEQDNAGNNPTTITYDNVNVIGGTASTAFQMGGGFGYNFRYGTIGNNPSGGWGTDPPGLLAVMNQGFGNFFQQLAGIVEFYYTDMGGTAWEIDNASTGSTSCATHWTLYEVLNESSYEPTLRINCGSASLIAFHIERMAYADPIGGLATPMVDVTNTGAISNMRVIEPFCASGLQAFFSGAPAGGIEFDSGSTGCITGLPGSVAYINRNVNGGSTTEQFNNVPVAVTGTGQFFYPMAIPSAPASAVVSSGGSVPVGPHIYAVTAVDVNGNQTFIGPTISATTTTGNQTVTISGPTSPPAGTVGYQVYRDGLWTTNYAGTCSLALPSIQGTTATYVDTHSSICNANPPSVNAGVTSALGSAGINTYQLKMANGFTDTLAPAVLSNTRTQTFPDVSGIVPVSSYVNSAYDNARRANGAIGSNWTVTHGGINVSSNALVGTTSGTDNSAAWGANSFSSSAQFSQVTVASLNGTSDFVGPTVLNSNTVGNAYDCVEDTTQLLLQRVTGGAGANLATASITGAPGDVLRLEATVSPAGTTTLTCYQNGVQQLQTTDTSYTSGFPGLLLFNNVATVVNWSGGNLHPLAHLDQEEDWTRTQHFTQGIALGAAPAESFNNNPRAEQNVFLPGALTSTWTGSTWTLDKAVTVTRLQVQAKTAPSGCTTNAVVRLSDGSTPVNVTVSAAANDSGPVTQSYAAGAAITVAVQTAASGCTTSPADANVVVQYRMQ